jgi:hypothetical protein
VSGSTFTVGTTTVTCTVADAAGNAASGSFTVTVEQRQRYTVVGFAPPVNMTAPLLTDPSQTGPAINVVNAGRTIPLKFTVTDNLTGQPVTDVRLVSGWLSFVSNPTACQFGTWTEIPLSGGTKTSKLEYDGKQFNINQGTPRNGSGCYTATVTPPGGGGIVGYFKLVS